MVASEHRNHNVAVAYNGTQFSPAVLKDIPIGDTLTFYFYPRNYSIVRSSFHKPCTPLTGGTDQHPIFSGFDYDSTNGISLNKFVVNVTTTDTIWIYGYDGDQSNGGNICQKAMVMVLNPLPKDRADGQSLKAYIKNANAVTLDGNAETVEKCPGKIFGGERVRLSEKQKAMWESRHPQGGAFNALGGDGSAVVGINGTTTAGKGENDTVNVTGTGVAQYRSGAGMGVGNGGFEKSLIAAAVLVGAGAFGLGL